MIGVCVQRLV